MWAAHHDHDAYPGLHGPHAGSPRQSQCQCIATTSSTSLRLFLSHGTAMGDGMEHSFSRGPSDAAHTLQLGAGLGVGVLCLTLYFVRRAAAERDVQDRRVQLPGEGQRVLPGQRALRLHGHLEGTGPATPPQEVEAILLGGRMRACPCAEPFRRTCSDSLVVPFPILNTRADQVPIWAMRVPLVVKATRHLMSVRDHSSKNVWRIDQRNVRGLPCQRLYGSVSADSTAIPVRRW